MPANFAPVVGYVAERTAAVTVRGDGSTRERPERTCTKRASELIGDAAHDALLLAQSGERFVRESRVHVSIAIKREARRRVIAPHGEKQRLRRVLERGGWIAWKRCLRRIHWVRLAEQRVDESIGKTARSVDAVPVMCRVQSGRKEFAAANVHESKR